MFSVVSEVLSDGAGGVRGQELQGSGFGGGSSDDNRVFQGIVFLQDVHNIDHSRTFLSDSYINAI